MSSDPHWVLNAEAFQFVLFPLMGNAGHPYLIGLISDVWIRDDPAPSCLGSGTCPSCLCFQLGVHWNFEQSSLPGRRHGR